MTPSATASQTVGPFFSIGMAPLYQGRLFEPESSADLVTITGRVFDGSHEPISDALLELWQADVAGQYAARADHGARHPGFARVPTDADGAFRFQTLKPGRVIGPSGTLQAPHINVCVFMRGLLKPVRTRLYFPADPSHTDDPVLALVPAARRSTLIARAGAAGTLHWDVCMQGEAETVFFEF
jgi:protocatechuate 3,4-dioxygenase alpha subunit